ncbi:DUF4355 domain-containing protein [Clostridium pasteurianum]|uniref:Uncharacterized protein n=1 Tax=Clostridium pasteurianum BC1 TaxID=86416 RepID=R4KES0_CLOPA|nr:DUF4355 domain-containing protein [Clostridium pasteurianum]AGK98110.1 hypothetical protein Clopa_3309 [Clostridium pasteurianum BC1]
MTGDEIKALTEAITKGGDELTNYIKGLTPTEPQAITLNGVTKFLAENEDGKKYLQSYADSKVTNGVQTAIDNFKKDKLPGLIDEEYKKKYPEADPKDKTLADLQAKIAKIEADSLRKDLTNKALKTLTEKKLPSELADFVVGNDEDATSKNLETLTNLFNKYGETVKTEFAKTSGSYKPPKDDYKPGLYFYI